MRGRRDVFPADWGLRIRMLVVLALDSILVVALVAAIFYVTFWVRSGWSLTLLFLGLVVAGAAFSSKARKHRDRGRAVHRKDNERMREAVGRLCVVADVATPDVEVRRERAAQSWTVAVPWRRPRIYATTALLDRLDDRALEAVVGHELSHVAHRDAWVMTPVAAPGIWVLRGMRQIWEHTDDQFRAATSVFVFLLLFGWIAVPFALLARLLSRYRELAADAGAARLTGSPAALADALTSLSGDLSAARGRDLRGAAARDLLQILPARDPRGVRRLWATHPPLQRRLHRLELLESELQRAR